MPKRYTSYEDMPLYLNADQIAALIGISRAGAYQLMHTKDFPTIKIGRRMVVSKERLLQWLDSHTGQDESFFYWEGLNGQKTR